jgi:hypothetical protein
MRLLALLASALLSASALAMGNFGAQPVKVAIPLYGTYCLDPGATATAWSHSTPPTLFIAGGKQGVVMPGTCAWVDGAARMLRVQLGCPDYRGGWVLSQRAQFTAVPGGACAVPAAQDFR